MRSIGTIAVATLREHLRESGLHALIALVWLLLLAAVALAELSAGQRLRVVTDVGLAATRLGGLCAALFLGGGVVAREVERRSATATLTAPVERWAWLLGRFGGVFLALVVLVAATGVLLFVVVAVLMVTPQAAAAPSLLGLGLRLSPALLLVLVEVTIVAALATMFSAFSSHLFAMVCSLGLWVAGHYAQTAAHLATNASEAWVSALNGLLWCILPNVSVFAVATRIAHDDPVRSGEVTLALTYGVVYAAAMLAIGSGLFARRDI